MPAARNLFCIQSGDGATDTLLKVMPLYLGAASEAVTSTATPLVAGFSLKDNTEGILT